MITESDMTIYAKSNLDGKDVWTRTAFPKVHWEDAKGANVARTGMIEADRAIIYVPLSSGNLSVKSGDVLVRGIVDDDPEGAGFSIKYLKATYASAVTVRTVDKNNYGSLGLHHWQIGAT